MCEKFGFGLIIVLGCVVIGVDVIVIGLFRVMFGFYLFYLMIEKKFYI